MNASCLMVERTIPVIQITLPLPPSDNERLIVAWKQRRMILSKKYRDYKEYVKRKVLINRTDYFPVIGTILNPTFDNQLRMVLRFYLKDKRRDCTDMLKCLLDSLKGVLFKDDKYILPIFEKIEIDSNNPRVVILIG